MAADTHKVRAATAAQWTATNPILLIRQMAWETDTRKSKLGDGVTAWNSLPYCNDGGNESSASGISAAGTNQATATALTKTNNRIDTVTPGTGVKPNATATEGFKQIVQHKGAADLFYYPFSGNNFLGEAANVPITISPGNQVSVFCYDNNELTLI